MKYLHLISIKQKIEVSDSFNDSCAREFLAQNNITGNYQIMNFDSLGEGDKIKFLRKEIEQLKKENKRWEDLCARMRESRRFQIPAIHKFAEGYEIGRNSS